MILGVGSAAVALSDPWRAAEFSQTVHVLPAQYYQCSPIFPATLLATSTR